MTGYLRCPICGLPLHRQPGLERVVPHSRGRDCPQGHALTTPAQVWEKARIQGYIDELEEFLHPPDTVTCAEHQWSLVEVDDVLLVLQCSRCASLTTVPIDAFR